MSFQIKCSIAFATADPFANAPAFTDITTDSQGNPTVISFDITRGRMHELDMIEPGSATIVLNNASGDFWPAGPHSPNVIPLKRIKLQLVYNAVTYPLFEGLIEGWVADWLSPGLLHPIMVLECTDVMAAMSRCESYSAFSSGAVYNRIPQILNEIPWGATPRFIDTTYTVASLQAEPVPSGTESHNLVELLHQANQAEAGIMLIGKNGYFNFYGRNYARSLTSQVTYSDNPGAGEIQYTLLEFSFDSQHIYNDIRVINRGGTTIHQASDLDSQAAYGVRVQELRNVVLASEIDADFLAVYKQARLSQPRMRVKALHLKDNAFFAANSIMPKAVQYDIPARVTVECSQASINDDYYIQGEKLSYNAQGPEGGNMDVELQLMAIDRLVKLDAVHTAHVLNAGAVYLTVRNAASGTSAPDDNAQEYFGQSFDGNYTVYRAVNYFDFSGIDPAETVTGVDLWLYFTVPMDTFTITLLDGVLVAQPLTVDDYNDISYGQPALGSIADSEIIPNSYNRISLNAAGIAWAQAQIDSAITSAKLAVVSDEDVSATPPGGTDFDSFYGKGDPSGRLPVLMVKLA